jgi:hypothetical protein
LGRTKGSTNKTKQMELTIDTQEIPTNESKFFIPRNYARSQIQPLWATSSTTSVSSFTNEQITNMLKNPYANYKQLQLVSTSLINTNSNYDNVVDYLSTIMTFDSVLFPYGITENLTTVKNRIYNSSRIVSKMTLKNVFPQMLKQAIYYGEAFFYDLSDNDNTIIDEIPREICVLSQIDDDNLWRYYVDLALIHVTKLYELPEEIQTAYNNYTSNGKPKGKKKVTDNEFAFIPQSYYEVSKKGFAIMIHMKKKAHDYPLLAHMFCDLSLLSSDKSYFNEFIKDSEIKTIHQKVPTDKETGLPLMEKGVIEAYHNSSKENVGRNISIMTNPFEVEGITLDGSQKSALNVVEHDIKVIQNDSGISETIFNANTTNGLSYSTQADASRVYPLLYFFTNFVNYKIKPYKCQIEFLRTNIFEKKETHESNRADLLSGGSRSLFMATSGLDLYTYMNLCEMEKLLSFDEMLPPKLNASQGSASDLANPNGRPPADSKTASDSTNKGNEYK